MDSSDFMKIFLGMGGFILTLGLLGYILTSFSYMKIFKAFNYSHPGYAFIPIYNLYILADLTCGDYFNLGDFKIEKKYFVWWWLFAFVIGLVPGIGSIFELAIIILSEGYCRKVAFSRIDDKYTGSIIAYVSVLIPIIMWVIVLPSKINNYN